VILVTGFRPFDQRSVNGAETIARSLHGASIGGEQIETRLINVVWTDVDRFCSGVLRHTSARLVLSIGEADRPWPTFESLAQPLCEGPDVLGNTADGALGEYKSSRSRLRFDASWFDGSENAPRDSTDAGSYLCNYLLMRGLDACPQPFGFLHLPVQSNLRTDRYLAKYRPVAQTIIERNLDLL